jgi:hypothetical protein
MARCTPRTTRTLSSPSRHSISVYLSLSLSLALALSPERRAKARGPDRQQIGGRTTSPAGRRQPDTQALCSGLANWTELGREISLGRQEESAAEQEAGRQARGADDYAHACADTVVSWLAPIFYISGPSISSGVVSNLALAHRQRQDGPPDMDAHEDNNVIGLAQTSRAS